MVCHYPEFPGPVSKGRLFAYSPHAQTQLPATARDEPQLWILPVIFGLTLSTPNSAQTLAPSCPPPAPSLELAPLEAERGGLSSFLGQGPLIPQLSQTGLPPRGSTPSLKASDFLSCS